MARFCTLFSGSSGNSTYLGCKEQGALIDAGASCKAILSALRQRELVQESIGAIVLTHEHSDHVKGVRVLLKTLQVPLYAPKETLEYLAEKNQLPSGCQVQEITAGQPFEAAGMWFTPFDTSHDAAASCGYRVQLPDERVVSVATDLGYISPEVHQGISGSDLVLLEANYDSAMLQCSAYPYLLKRRIASQSGHLSNTDCAKEALALVRQGTGRLVLGHLSKENNMPLLAYETVNAELKAAGMQQGKDYLLQVAERSGPGDLILF